MAGVYYKPGRYACKVAGQAFKQASTGTTQFALQVTVLGAVDPNDPGGYLTGYSQYERTIYRALTDKTIEYFIGDLKTLGVTVSSFKDLDPNTPGFVNLTGTDVDCTCEHEAGLDGVMREKWAIARAASDFKAEPLSPQKARELDNLFGKQLKAALKPKPQAQTTAMGIDDRDVPF